MADIRGASTKVEGQTGANTAVKGNPMLMGASDGTNVQNLQVAPAGDVKVVSITSTATLTNVSSSATTVSLLASNTSRKGAIIFNDSTAVLYLKFGTTASLTSYTVQIPSNGYFELPLPVFMGAMDGIWASANGAARITELT